MWLKTTRITLLVALLLVTAVVAWLAAHPQVYAGQLGRMVSRNLLDDAGLTLSFRTFEGNPLRGLRLLDVSVVGRGQGTGFTYLRCDTLAISYDARAFLAGEIHVHSLVISNARVLSRRADKLPGPKPKGPAKPIPVPNFRGRRLTVDHLEVREASLMVSSPSGEQVEEIGRMRLLGSAKGAGDSVRVEVVAVTGRWPSRKVTVQHAQGSVVLKPSGVHLEQAVAALDTSRAEVRGDIAVGGGLDLQVRGGPVQLTEVFRLLSLGQVPRVTMTGTAHIAKTDSLRLEGFGSGQIATYPFRDVHLKATIHDDWMDVQRAQGILLEAQVDGTAKVGFKTSVLEARAHMAHADLSQPWTGKDLQWPATDLAADVQIRVHMVPPVTVDLQVQRGKGEALTVPMDSVYVALHFDEHAGVEFQTARARSLGAALTAEGTIDSAGVAAILVRARAENLDAWRDRFGLPLTGTGLEAAGLLSGPGPFPSLRVGASLRTLDAYGFSAWGAQATVELDRFDSGDNARGDLIAPGLFYRGRRLGALEAEVRRARPVTDITRLSLATGDTTLTAQLSIQEQADGRVHLDINSMHFALSDEMWSLSGPAGATVHGTAVQLDGLDVVSRTGRVQLSGGVDENDRLAIRLELREGELALLPRLGVGPADLHGLVSGVVELTGDRDRPDVALSVDVTDAVVAQRAFDRLRLRLASDGSLVRADTLEVESPGASLTLGGSVRMSDAAWLRTLARAPQHWFQQLSPAQLDLRVRAHQINPLYWQHPDLPDSSLGTVAFDLGVGGTALHPQVHGRAEVYNVRSGELILPGLTAEVVADSTGLRIEQGTILAPVEWANVRGKLPLRLSALRAPRWDPKVGVDLHIETPGEVPLDPLPNIWPHFTRIGGKGILEFHATGDPDHPVLSGRLVVRDGAVQVERTLESFRDVEIDAHFEKNKLLVERVFGHEGMRGQVEAHGEVTFKGLVPDDIWLDIRTDRFQFLSVPRLFGLLRSDNLKLRLARAVPGSPRAPKLTGNVDVIQAEYTGEFAEPGGQSSGGIVETDRPDWLAELDIRTIGLVTIDNKAMTVRVEGDVRFIRDEAGLTLVGQVDVPQGRVPIFNNDFTITSGRLNFTRGDRLVPQVDITAETNVPVYGDQRELGRSLERVTVQLNGPLSTPTVSFSSESGYDKETIVRLLAGFSTTGSGPGRGAIADVALAGALNQLERGLASDIGLFDTIDIDPGQTSVADQGRSTRIAVGKYLFPQLYLKYGQGFSVGERDVFLEYQIQRHLLFTTEVKRRLREAATAETEYNFDLKYRVEY